MADTEDVIKPYQTTYDKEFYGIRGRPKSAIRPQTSNGYRVPYDLNEPIGGTTYDKEYSQKPQEPCDSLPTGTATGARRNRPHPEKNFIIYRQKPRYTYSEQGDWSQPLSEDKVKEVLGSRAKSTYTVDYLGIPQAFQISQSHQPTQDWTDKVPYRTDQSLQRDSYQQPNQAPVLMNNITRYGCNADRFRAANGVVPVVGRELNQLSGTSYDDQFCKTAPPISQTRGMPSRKSMGLS